MRFAIASFLFILLSTLTVTAQLENNSIMKNEEQDDYSFLGKHEYNYTDHSKLLAARKIGEKGLRLLQYGSCYGGKLQELDAVQNSIKEQFLYEYVLKADFYVDKNTWALLAIVQLADDVSDQYLILTYESPQGKVTKKINIETLSTYSSFCIYGEHIVIVDDGSTKFYVTDFDGELVSQFNPGIEVSQIFSFQSMLYLISQNSIYIINSAFEVVEVLNLNSTITLAKKFESNLYLYAEDKIVRISSEDLATTFYPIAHDGELIDYTLSHDKITMLFKMDHIYSFQEYGSLDGEIINQYSYSLPNIDIEGFIPGFDSQKVYGHRLFFDNQYSFIMPISDLGEIINDIAINVIEVKVDVDTIMFQNIIDLSYTYKIQYEVENKSEAINSFQLISSPFEGINCVHNAIETQVSSLVEMNHKNIFSTSITSYFLKDEVCLSAFAPNGQLDKNPADNLSCMESIISNTNTVVKTSVTLYPNPANQLLHIDSDIPIKEATVYNNSGECVMHLSGHDIMHINLTNLEPGVYSVRITKDNHPPEMQRIIKL